MHLSNIWKRQKNHTGKKVAQIFRNSRKAMGSVQQALDQKLLSRPKQGIVLFIDEGFHAQGRSNVSAFVLGVACVVRNMVNGDVEFSLRPQNKVVTFAAQGNVPSRLGDTQSDTSCVFRVRQNANTFATGELSSVIAARGCTYKHQMARITRERAAQDSNKVVKRNGGNPPARQLGTVGLALESSIGETPPTRRPDPSHSGRGTASGKHGKAFCWLGQPEVGRS